MSGNHSEDTCGSSAEIARDKRNTSDCDRLKNAWELSERPNEAQVNSLRNKFSTVQITVGVSLLLLGFSGSTCLLPSVEAQSHQVSSKVERKNLMLELSTLQRNNKHKKALEKCEAALKADPDDVELLRAKMWILDELGRKREKLEIWDRIATEHPESVHPELLIKATFEYELGEYEKSYRDIQASKFDDPQSRMLKAALLARQGRKAEAKREFDKAAFLFESTGESGFENFEVVKWAKSQLGIDKVVTPAPIETDRNKVLGQVDKLIEKNRALKKEDLEFLTAHPFVESVNNDFRTVTSRGNDEDLWISVQLRQMVNNGDFPSVDLGLNPLALRISEKEVIDKYGTPDPRIQPRGTHCGFSLPPKKLRYQQGPLTIDFLFDSMGRRGLTGVSISWESKKRVGG